MKKYGWTIGLCLFSAAVIAAFLVYSAFDRLPQYALVTVEGDESAAARVELLGHTTVAGLYGPIAVTTEGGIYDSEKSYYRKTIAEARPWIDYMPDIRKLQEDYRNFMRGKGNYRGLYQDDDWLVYVETSGSYAPGKGDSVTFHVDMLDKTSNQKKRFSAKVTLPSEALPYEFDYVDVLDVQRVGKELHVMTMQDQTCVVFVMDPDSGSVLRADALDFGAFGEGGAIPVQIIGEARRSYPNEHVVIMLKEWIPLTDGAAMSSEHELEYLASYHYATGEIREIAGMERDRAGDMFNDYQIEEGVLSLINYNANQAEFRSFRLDSGEVRSFVVHAQQFGAESIESVKLSDGKLHLLLLGDEPSLVILDARSGETLYRGIVKAEGNAEEARRHMEELHLHNLEIRA